MEKFIIVFTIFYNLFTFFQKALSENVFFYFNMHFFSILFFQLPFFFRYVILKA